MTIAEGLGEFVVELRWSELPDEVRARARLCLLDMLGATLAGAQTPTGELGAALARRYGGPAEAQLIGQLVRAAAPWAALANGLACHSLELDDGHRYAIGLHNAATTLPAALAAAEAGGASLEALLAALVVGYEVASRIGTAIGPRHRQLGFHSTGTVGVFGAAAASARLRGLTAEQTARAFGIAGSGAGGIFEFLSDGSTSKHFHAGHAALTGLLAADLAAGGLTGPLSILEGREGFLRIYGGEARSESILAGLGERFELPNVYFKLHAACAHCFSPIDAALELRERAAADEVERVVVSTYHAGAILDAPQPRTRPAAKFSIPYCVAAAWVHGRVSEQLFEPEFLADPAVQGLAARVEVREDPALEADFPRTRAARLEAVLRDGRRLERLVELPAGMPERPASPEALREKFQGLAEPIVGPAASSALLALALEGGPQPAAELLALAVPAPSA